MSNRRRPYTALLVTAVWALQGAPVLATSLPEKPSSKLQELDDMMINPALACYEEAVIVSRAELKHAPNDASIKKHYELALASRKAFSAKLNDPADNTDLDDLLKKAFSDFDKFLSQNKATAACYRLRGHLGYHISYWACDDVNSLAVTEEARRYAREAVKSFQKALALNPQCARSIEHDFRGSEQLAAGKLPKHESELIASIKKTLQEGVSPVQLAAAIPKDDLTKLSQEQLVAALKAALAQKAAATSPAETLPAVVPKADNQSILTARVEKIEPIKPIRPELASGQKFDQAKIFAVLAKTNEANQWIKIPDWTNYMWQQDPTRSPSVVNESNLAPRKLPSVGIWGVNTVDPVHYDLGHYTDASGQTWQYQVPAHWKEKDDGTYIHHTLILPPEIIESSAKTFASAEHRFEFVVDPRNNKIVEVLRIIRENKRTFLEPESKTISGNEFERNGLGIPPVPANSASVTIAFATFTQQNGRGENAVKIYNEKGEPISIGRSDIYYKASGKIRADSSLKLPDGRSLFAMFKDFLTANGMADKLPPTPTAPDLMPFATNGQVDYSKTVVEPAVRLDTPIKLDAPSSTN